MTAVAALQGLPRCASRRGGRDGRGGTPGCVGEVRQWLWARGYGGASMEASAMAGNGRGEAWGGEWGVGEVGATTWRRSTRRNGDQGDAERLGGAWQARARHAHLPA